MPLSFLHDISGRILDRHVARHAALCALLLALAGCGNKGPLYLPSSPEPREAAGTAPAPAVAPSATPDNQ